MSDHSAVAQRFIVHEIASGFTLTSAADKSKVINYEGQTAYQAQKTDGLPFTVNYLGGGKGYAVQVGKEKYLRISNNGSLVVGDKAAGFEVFSVTYGH